MKKNLTIIMMLVALVGFSQAPQGINYQAVLRNTAGQALPNTAVSLKFIIHDITAGGNTLFTETVDTTTNSLGLVSLKIGATANLGTVNWSSGDKYLQVESDINHTGSYTDLGTSQLLSVPYALYSGTTNNPNQWQKNGNNIYYNNGNVGIGDSTPTAKLSVKNANVVFEGYPSYNGFGPAPRSGPGTLMMWYADVAAFRVGVATGNEWDTDSVGQNSFAAGYHVKVKNGGLAAIGANLNVTAESAFAIGDHSDATDDRAVALGSYDQATGFYSLAAGYTNTASGGGAVAIGNDNVATENLALAVGGYNQAKGYSAVALGTFCITDGGQAVAIGYADTASAGTSVALGSSNNASAAAAVAIGFGNHAAGTYSLAAGDKCSTYGSSSFAFGEQNFAVGDFAGAMGYGSYGGGMSSIAIGAGDSAKANNSMALGTYSAASGFASVAIGYSCKASGSYSTAMGDNASTNGKTGAFIISDNSNTGTVTNDADNQMKMRFSGGYKLYTNAGTTVGASMLAGGNSWATMSDRRIKENLAPTNGEEFLKKISAFKLYSWNYIGQDPKAFRHYGPMAQDFYAAFGKDAYGTIGNDTTIAQADFEGVSFVAIQALEKRTAELAETQKQLQQQIQLVDMLMKKNEALEKRVARLEK